MTKQQRRNNRCIDIQKHPHYIITSEAYEALTALATAARAVRAAERAAEPGRSWDRMYDREIHQLCEALDRLDTLDSEAVES